MTLKVWIAYFIYFSYRYWNLAGTFVFRSCQIRCFLCWSDPELTFSDSELWSNPTFFFTKKTVFNNRTGLKIGISYCGSGSREPNPDTGISITKKEIHISPLSYSHCESGSKTLSDLEDLGPDWTMSYPQQWHQRSKFEWRKIVSLPAKCNCQIYETFLKIIKIMLPHLSALHRTWQLAGRK